MKEIPLHAVMATWPIHSSDGGCPGRKSSSVKLLGDMMISLATASGSRDAGRPTRSERRLFCSPSAHPTPPLWPARYPLIDALVWPGMIEILLVFRHHAMQVSFAQDQKMV